MNNDHDEQDDSNSWGSRCLYNQYCHDCCGFQIQSSAVITRSNISKLIAYMIAGTQTKNQSNAGFTRNTSYLALTGKLWGVFRECVWETWSRNIGVLPFVAISFYRSCLSLQMKNFLFYSVLLTGSKLHQFCRVTFADSLIESHSLPGYPLSTGHVGMRKIGYVLVPACVRLCLI